jgi:ABC-2 type transport system ATP-binding protein
MPVPAVTLTSLTKNYGGSRGVEDVNLRVEQGQVFGFLGPNGAGKTTTIRLLLDFIRPSSGTAQIFGMDSHHDAVAIHKRVGYLSGEMAMDNRLSGRQYLEYTANLRGGVPWSTVQKLIDRLQCETDKKIGYLSRGNKQKVGLVATLMHEPDLLILDEPTSGLDPLIQAEFQTLLREHRAKGKTTFISSHVLGEVQEICDHVGFIREGQLVDVQPLQTLMRRSFKKVRVVLVRPKAKLFDNVKGVTDVQVDGREVTCKVIDNFNALLQALSKVSVKDIAIEEASLEDLFLHYYQSQASQNQEDENV